MNALPWYKSPVYIGIVVNLVYGLFNLLGMADVVKLEDINLYVANAFGLVAFVALVIAEIKRRKSPIQPIALTKGSAARL